VLPPGRHNEQVAVRVRARSLDTDRLIRVLDRLEGFLSSAPVTLIWDNLGAHRSKAMRAYVATHAWPELEFLPPYAPELNPVEGVCQSERW
jgi:transposase